MGSDAFVKSCEQFPPVHPGEILLHDFLEPLGLSQSALADALDVTPMRVSQIVRGHRAITADTALRLSRYFGTRPGWWLDLQTHYDLETAGDELEARIARTVKLCKLRPAAEPVAARVFPALTFTGIAVKPRLRSCAPPSSHRRCSRWFQRPRAESVKQKPVVSDQ
jgi:addiction module HigA family antidote